jgi:hypothetical protein
MNATAAKTENQEWIEFRTGDIGVKNEVTGFAAAALRGVKFATVNLRRGGP